MGPWDPWPNICVWAPCMGPWDPWPLDICVWALCMGPWDPWPLKKDHDTFKETSMTFYRNQYDCL